MSLRRNKKLVDWFWRGTPGGGLQSYFAPELRAFNIYTDKMDLWWENVDADSYTLERATDSDFTVGLTTIYTGTATTYQDTSLASGTTYYYRVKGSKAGFEDSGYGTDSAQTISFTPLAWWEMTGLQYNTTNTYGKLTNNEVDNVYSILPTTGIDINFDTTKGGVVLTDSDKSTMSFGNNNNAYALSSLLTLSGDFTIAMTMRIANPVNHYLFCRTSDTGQYIRFSSISSIQFRPGAGPYGVSFPSAPVANRWFNCVMKRVGTTFYVSSDGGQNYNSVAGASNAFNFDIIFAQTLAEGLVMNITLKRMMVVASDLTATQLGEFFNYEVRPSETQTAEPTSINTLQTYVDLTDSNYIIDNSINAAGTAGSYRTRVLTFADKSFAVLHKINNTTHYLEDCIFVFDHTTGRVSPRLDLGVPFNDTDVHNNGSIVRWKNRIYHLEESSHYTVGNTQNLVIKKSLDNFNLSKPFNLQPNSKGVPFVTAVRTQYHQFLTLNNKIYCICQEWNGSSAQWVSILISSDGGNSWDKYRILNSATSGDFAYPQLLYSENKLRVFVGIYDSGVRYLHQIYLESTDGITWTNLSGGFSQNVSNNNPIALTTALSNNFRVGLDATALAGNVKIGHAFQDSGGEVWCIQGDGNDTGLNLVRGTSGGSFTSQALDFGVHSIITTWLSSDGDNLPFAIKTATDSFDIYVHRTNGGNWEIVKFTTTDGGVTCTFDSIISNDNTNKHWRMFPSKNAMFANYIALFAIRSQTTYGDVFIKDISI
jgi:hypothetical protein